MFAITTSPTWLARTDEFKKVGKKIQKQRQTEVDRIKDKIGDIARDEQRRVKEIFKEHQDIFKKNILDTIKDDITNNIKKKLKDII